MVRGALPPGAERAPPPTPSTEGGAPAVQSDIPDNRYVNDKFEGLKGGDTAPYQEFNMMPVRMRLVIDQRKLAKLLVECANSSMPIEVRKVSMLPRGETRTQPAGKGGAAAAAAASPSNEMAVDLEGRIYIFKPPQVKADAAAEAEKKPDAKEAAGKPETEKPERRQDRRGEARNRTQARTGRRQDRGPGRQDRSGRRQAGSRRQTETRIIRTRIGGGSTTATPKSETLSSAVRHGIRN